MRGLLATYNDMLRYLDPGSIERFNAGGGSTIAEIVDQLIKKNSRSREFIQKFLSAPEAKLVDPSSGRAGQPGLLAN